jgi:hypothetical protein
MRQNEEIRSQENSSLLRNNLQNGQVHDSITMILAKMDNLTNLFLEFS